MAERIIPRDLRGGKRELPFFSDSIAWEKTKRRTR
jgi:hypothetical protein